jgi:hypothetical protein
MICHTDSDLFSEPGEYERCQAIGVAAHQLGRYGVIAPSGQSARRDPCPIQHKPSGRAVADGEDPRYLARSSLRSPTTARCRGHRLIQPESSRFNSRLSYRRPMTRPLSCITNGCGSHRCCHAPSLPNKQSLMSTHVPADLQGFSYAPEWTRTTTPLTQDKALNPIRGVLMGPGASRSSILLGLPEALDRSGGVDVLKVFSELRALDGKVRPPCGVRRALDARLSHYKLKGLAV